MALPFSIDFIRRIRLPALLIVAYLSLGSVVEVLVAGWPVHVHDVNWRLSALNSAAGATGTELLALLLLVVVVQLSMSVAGLWTAFWASIAVALGYLAALGVFGLDSLQLRGRIPANELHRFDITVVWALARFGIAEMVCLALAACALAAARALRREMAETRPIGSSSARRRWRNPRPRYAAGSPRRATEKASVRSSSRTR